MSNLTSGQRKALQPSDFAGPGRNYPVNDAAHARAAIGLSGQGVAAGNIPSAEAAHIKARASAVLGTAKRHMSPRA